MGARQSAAPLARRGRHFHRGGIRDISLQRRHHHNRAWHERVLFVSTINTNDPDVPPSKRVRLVPIRAGITRVLLDLGLQEDNSNAMEGLKLACRDPSLQGINPEQITNYFRRVMVAPTGKVPGMAIWRKSIFEPCISTPSSRCLFRRAPRPTWWK